MPFTIFADVVASQTLVTLRVDDSTLGTAGALASAVLETTLVDGPPGSGSERDLARPDVALQVGASDARLVDDMSCDLCAVAPANSPLDAWPLMCRRHVRLLPGVDVGGAVGGVSMRDTRHAIGAAGAHVQAGRAPSASARATGRKMKTTPVPPRGGHTRRPAPAISAQIRPPGPSA